MGEFSKNYIKNMIRRKVTKKLPPDFPIKLDIGKKQLNNANTLGSHNNYVIYAYDIEIARFIDPVSAEQYVKFLVESYFKPFKDSDEGIGILGAIYDSYLKQDLKNVQFNKQQGIVIEDINNRKFLGEA